MNAIERPIPPRLLSRPLRALALVVGVLLSAAATLALGVLPADAVPLSALAAHEQVNHNSAASDGRVFVQQDGAIYYLSPDHEVRIYTGTDRSVVVNGYSFRVRYDKTSGPYQACQNIPGSKRFTPAVSPYRIDYLLYAHSNCKH